MTTIFQTKKRAGKAAGSKAGREDLRKRAKQHEKQAAKHAKHHGRKHKKKHKHRKAAPRPTLHGSAGVALPLAPASPPPPSSTPPPSIGSPPITLAQAQPAAVARGLRPDTRAGRGAGRPTAAAGRLRPDPPVRSGDAERPGTGRRRRQPARPRQRMGRRSLLVAGPDGPLRPAARGADDLHLARLVRQLQRKGGQPAD